MWDNGLDTALYKNIPFTSQHLHARLRESESPGAAAPRLPRTPPRRLYARPPTRDTPRVARRRDPAVSQPTRKLLVPSTDAQTQLFHAQRDATPAQVHHPRLVTNQSNHTLFTMENHLTVSVICCIEQVNV